MLPEDLELQSPQKKEWPLIPADVYHTEITGIEYKMEPNRYKQKATDPDEKQIMNFEFTIIEEGPMYGRKLWQKMSPVKPYPPQTKGKESWIYRLASAMVGHPITSGEADHFTAQDINDYFHGQVRVTVKHSQGKDGRVWNNIESFLTAKTQLPPFDPEKVPTENQPAKPAEAQPKSGYDKFKEQAERLPGPSVEKTLEQETVAPDIAEEAKRMEAQGDVNVDDIPF